MESFKASLTPELIKDKIGYYTGYDSLFITDEEIGDSYFHVITFGNKKLHIAEYMGQEFYINQNNGTTIICESLEEAIEKINSIIK